MSTRNHTDEQIKAMTLKEAEAELSNAVYSASLLMERLEHAGKVNGNGHHAAQNVAAFAVKELQGRWRANA